MRSGDHLFPLDLRALLSNEGGTEMKNKSLIPNIAVLLVVALVCVLTGQIYLQQQKDDVLYTENPDITGVIRLSDYNPT